MELMKRRQKLEVMKLIKEEEMKEVERNNVMDVRITRSHLMF